MSKKPTTECKPRARMFNWRIKNNRLEGNVYGHPDKKDGSLLLTSKIVDKNMELKTVETEFTIYLLEDEEF